MISITDVEKFLKAYEDLLVLANDAIQHAPMSPGAEGWKNTAIPNFEREIRRIKEAATKFLAGDPSEIGSCADEACGISKDLDGCCSDNFAGPEFEKRLRAAVGKLVSAAYRVYSSAQPGHKR